MKRAAAVLLCVSVVGLLAVALTPGTASARRSCGTIPSTSVYPRARVIAIRGVSCATARRVARSYDNRGSAPSPWRCGLAHGDRPRLFSCGYPAGGGSLTRSRHALEAIGAR